MPKLISWPQSSERKNSSWLHIIVLSVLFGPPIGSLLLLVFFAAGGLINGSDIGLVLFLATLTPVAVLYSYFYGGVQALLSGVILSKISDANSHFTYMEALVATAATGVIVGIGILLHASDLYWLAGILFFVGCGSGLIFRYMFQRRFAPLNVDL